MQRLPSRPTKSEEPNSRDCNRQRSQVIDMVERYGDANRFLTLFTPHLQRTVAKEWVRAYSGYAPKLLTVIQGYGMDTAVYWICTQLEDINLFTNVPGKLAVNKQQELARLLLVQYEQLKVTEMMLFFHRLKCGFYGRFYGSVDAMFITEALLVFMKERLRDLREINQIRLKRQVAYTPPADAITYRQYLEIKRRQEEEKNNHQKSTEYGEENE